MAKIISSEGLVMNQSNHSTAYMRYYSRGKNDVGPYIRFNIAAGNPHVHIMVKSYLAFTQTNANDFHSSCFRWSALDVDPSGNCYAGFIIGWSSGASISMDWNLSTRQAELYVFTGTTGSWPGRGSILSEIWCDRWDYVTISNP